MYPAQWSSFVRAQEQRAAALAAAEADAPDPGCPSSSLPDLTSDPECAFDQPDCVICLDPLAADAASSSSSSKAPSYAVLPCGHVFHGDCVIPWLRQRNACPICKQPMPVRRMSLSERVAPGLNNESASASYSASSLSGPDDTDDEGEYDDDTVESPDTLLLPV
jgi:hypothetical protein